MDLFNFYNYCLNDSDKRYLAYLLKKEKVKASTELLLQDWLNITECSVRLKNLLYFISRTHNIVPSEITEKIFFYHKGSGPKTWEEFRELRGDNL